MKPKLLVFAGSLRRDSFNKKVASAAVALLEDAGAEVIHIDLKDYPMPPYDGDIQDNSGLPQTAIDLKKLMREADGFFISAPEYNYSVGGTLKNVIDWASRAHEADEAPMVAYRGKIVALAAASPSPAGGIRGLLHLRAILEGIGCMVLPEQVTVASAHQAFNDDGSLKDQKTQDALKNLTRRLAEVSSKLKS